MNEKFTYSLNEDDYLNYQLFAASKSKNIRKKRLRNRFLPAIFFVVLGLVPRFDFTEIFTQIYILIGILWIFLYPIWDKKLYYNHYKKYIKENYKNNFDKTLELAITENEIYAKDNSTESKTNLQELEEINEVPQAIYFKFKSSHSLILPKNKINVSIDSKQFFKELSKKYSINYNEFSDWEWK
ncbi:YcxB family protein [Chryseobacterium sp. ERMR1:04]|uniref:YcxB family protein n=1 Tax=Chryseobacterium sp. ERMR1:04 TaxID=1705393 RepID=UPI0006C86838|nr:YcxB family protein [Chryseobacterium sp. ERMR1:04]KPH13105.1 hypothetical protein AMQ68_11490 [Chryseobacterium sp. ERMR1:04]